MLFGVKYINIWWCCMLEDKYSSNLICLILTYWLLNTYKNKSATFTLALFWWQIMEHRWYCLHTMHVFWITCRESQRYMFFVSNVCGSNINGILYLVDFCELVSREAPIYPIWNKVEILHEVWTKGCISSTTVQAVEDILIPKKYYSCPSPNIILNLLYFHLNTSVFFPIQFQAKTEKEKK